jgi:hypothetical protein
MAPSLSSSSRLINTVDGAVVMEIKSGLMYTSDPVGGRILELIKQGLSKEQIVESISHECEESNVSRETVRRDLERFIEQLASYGVLEAETLTA